MLIVSLATFCAVLSLEDDSLSYVAKFAAWHRLSASAHPFLVAMHCTWCVGASRSAGSETRDALLQSRPAGSTSGA